MELKNCYELFLKKYKIKIEEDLLLVINQAYQELPEMLQKNMKDWQDARSISTGSNFYKDKIYYEKIINSRNWILNNSGSAYTSIITGNYYNTENTALNIVWEWLKLDMEITDKLYRKKLSDLKDTILITLLHFIITKLPDMYKLGLIDEIEAGEIPSSDIVELYHIKHLTDENERLKSFEEFKDAQNKKQINELHSEISALKNERRAMQDYKTSYEIFRTTYFLDQDKLYEDYIIGDSLPELKILYKFLQKNKVYDSNWGYFAHCFSSSGLILNATLKITFVLTESDFSNNDIGYILYLIKRNYQFDHKMKFEKWVTENVEIITKQNKLMSPKKGRLERFYNENIRSYKDSAKKPQNFDYINKSLPFLVK